MIRILLVAPLLLLAGSAHAEGLADLAGGWQQSSSGKELVLQSRIKLQPSAAPNFGTNLGGSVGFGSMTNTTVVTEAVPADVDRRMTLDLKTDGSFVWAIVKTEPVDKTCTRTVRQEKWGIARLASGSLVFDVTGGEEGFEKNCGGSGGGTLAATREVYTLTFSKGRMILSDGTSNWIFARY